MIRVGIFGGMTLTAPAVFVRLPVQQRMAVIAHEKGHAANWHMLKRVLLKPFISRDAMAALMHAQEFEADAYAKARGHGPALAVVLLAYPEEATYTHPSTRARVAKLWL